MKTPNIFFHYWTTGEENLPFQEILQWEVDPVIIERIQNELLQQLTESQIQDILPNFPWASPRFLEKWSSISQSLVLQVQLPEKIWIEWIQQLGGNFPDSAQENLATPLEEVYPSFEELLTAEIYYERPSDSLEDSTSQIYYEHPSDTLEEIKQANSASESNTSPQEEQKAELPEEKVTESSVASSSEIVNASPADSISEPVFEVKNIMEMYAESPEERVFETIKTEDPSLKDRIHTNMTSSLAETLPLFQKINYIQHLFDGQAEHLDHIIRYIDHEYNQEDWKAYLNERFAVYQRAENAEIWQELFDTIERKFS
jgi:hypothetical protein